MAAITLSSPTLSVTSVATCSHSVRAASPACSKLTVRRVSFEERVRSQVGSRKGGVVCAYGDVSAEGTNYLIAGAVAVALIGTALPILFSRKDMCPQCEGAGFVRSSGSRLNANAATKAAQIVCPTCKGLGKLNQTDKN